MPSPRHFRLILLLLFALLAPCIVLTVLGVRMTRQERELSVKRLADEQQVLTAQLRQELLNRLERIKLLAQNSLTQPAGQFAHPAVALVARIAGDRLILPWDEPSSRQEFLKAISSPDFARKIGEGERQEFREKQPARAVSLYQEALQLARQPLQTAYARLLLARALDKAGRVPQARSHYLMLLELPPTLVDDQGMPFSLYAAGQLKAEKALQGILRKILEQPGWLAPSAFYRIAELLAPCPGDTTELKRTVEARLRDVEQALALQSKLPSLSTFGGTLDGEPGWTRFGEPPWLVGVAKPLGPAPAVLIAVRADAILGPLQRSSFRFLTAKAPGAWPLGANFPGLYLGLTSPPGESPSGWNPRQSFHLAVLVLVLTTTIVGAYLLWRDVRRELHMAEMRGQFVSSVSHELKTPLTAIRMFAETLRMRRWKDEQTQQEYLDTIVDESQRLARLVDNVLDFSRIERGKKIYNLKPASLAEVVRAAARAVRYPMGQQGFRLNAEVEDGLPPVRADADALEQAVLNLLTNAMKYSGDAREIGLRLRRVDSRARIEISDRGIGIPSEEQKRIFEKFYRVPTRENQLIPGTGLGLTLVEHVAKAHGGVVMVESRPGKGSTFSIELPLGDGQ